MSLLRLDLPVPNYSTISRRQGSLTVPIFASSKSRPRHIVIDATGLRVYGAGSGTSTSIAGFADVAGTNSIWESTSTRKRLWTRRLLASHVHDSQVLPRLLTQISGTVCQVSGDGAYDTKACYASIGQRKAKATISPRRNAKQMRCSHPPKKLAIRDANLRQIQQQGW